MQRLQAVSTEPTALSAEEHFDSLREAVWVRFRARHRASDRERFEDLYSEWWTREVERAAKGVPSRAEAPAAFIAEAVHRVLIDDARARARGLGRDAKGSLELVDYEAQRTVAAPDDTASAATYESLVHRVLTLVQDRLTARERRVFLWSYLYLRPTEATAAALGLSPPRVKKDRRRIAHKVGAEVWSVLTGELDLCSAYDEKRLPAVFELLTVHVEDCAMCSAALGGYRRSALAIAGPELLAAGAAEPLTHLWSDLVARANLLLHRGTEALTALPPNGRTAAAVAVAATAVAGGAATVVPEVHEHERAAKPEVAHRAPIVRSKPRVAAHPAPRPIPRARATVTARRAKPSAPHPVATPAATPAREPIGFETRPAAAPAAQARSASAGEQTKTPRQEFGFEQP